MNNIKRITAIILTIIMILSVTGCNEKSSSEVSSNKDEKVISVSTSMLFKDVLEKTKEEVKKLGYELDVEVFDDYVMPNVALQEGNVDINFYQHEPYLNNYNKEKGTNLLKYRERILAMPMAMYSNKINSLDELKEGSKVSIANDGSNRARTLRFLQDEGLIKLKEGVDLPTKLDIVENKKNLEFIEIEGFKLARSLEDVDMSVMVAIVMEMSGEDSQEALTFEQGDGRDVHSIVITVREGEENNPKAEILEKALKTDSVKNFIKDKYGDAIVPLW